MLKDPISEERQKRREEHARKFKYNLLAIFNDIKEQEKKSGRKFVSLPVKRAVRQEKKN